MAKRVSLVIVLLSVLSSQTYCMTFVNNVTVPSDILTKLFLEEIQNNPNLYSISIQNTKTYNSVKCVLGLQQIVNRFPSLEVLPFIDAWGKFPSGILYAHLRDLGNFDQCIRLSKTLSKATGQVNGQYCFASVPLTKNQIYSNFIKISVAICVPDTCDPSLLTAIFQKATANILGGALSGVHVDGCKTSKKPDFEAINIVGIVIFSIVGGVVALSTVYDAYTHHFEKPVVPVLLAFSILTNGRKLFAVSTSKSLNSIECLNAIRVLSMAWVVYCHNYSLTSLLPMINFIKFIPWLKAASSMHVVMGTLAVDSFFFISGLLVAWLGFRELDKSKGRVNVLLMYFHRYIRLTPPVIAVILFYLSINNYIGTGPLRNSFNIFHPACQKYWWSTLLYVQNYVNPDEMCVPQTWYLAVDFQLYVLSPLILIPLWKWGKKFMPVLVILSLLSIGCIVATYYTEGWNTFLGNVERKQARLTYAPTHTRYTVWLIGLGLGYFMHKNKHRSIRPGKLVQLLGWIICFVIIFAIIYGPYFTINSDRSTTVFEAAMYESLRRPAWGISLAWIVLACHSGFGGVVNSFLSHPFWQPLSRLTFSLYLVHMAVQTITFGMVRTDIYFSDYTLILYFWSIFGVSLMAAIVLALTFESPVLVIEKALLGPSKQKETRQQNIDVNKNNCMESSVT